MSSVFVKESFDLKVLVLNKYSDVRSAFESSQDQKFNNMILFHILESEDILKILENLKNFKKLTKLLIFEHL